MLVLLVQCVASHWKQHSPELSDCQIYLTRQSSSNRAPSLTDLGAEKSYVDLKMLLPSRLLPSTVP